MRPADPELPASPPPRPPRRDPARPRAHPGEPCRNCSDPTPGEYCRACGQRKVEVRASLRELVSDFFEDQFGIERRTPATLFALLFRPGHLTREYLDGRVVRYIRPLKLYLVSSLLLFLLVGIISARGMDAINLGGGADENSDPAAISTPAVPSGEDIRAEVLRGLATGGIATGAAMDTALAPALGDTVRRPPPEDEGADPEADTLPLPAAADSADPERPWYERGEVNTGSARVDAMIQTRMRRLGQMDPADAIRDVVRTLIGNIPTLMFLLLPVFAGLFQLLYLRSGRYYAEHFIFVLHAHAFVFGIFTLSIVASLVGASFAVPFLLLWAALYLFLALRRVYGQGKLKTAIKYWCLGWGYFWIFVLALPPLLVVAFLLGG